MKRRAKAAARQEPPADPWREHGLVALSRTAHTRACLACKGVLDHCGVADDDDYLARAAAAIRAHQKAKRNPSAGPPCTYADCVHHEAVERRLALALLHAGGESGTLRDIRGVRYGTVGLAVSEADRPEGYDMTRQDAVDRRFKHLPPAAGYVYVRVGPKRCEAHVWVAPAFKSRRESAEDPATLEEIREVYGPGLAAIRSWVMAKWEELRGLAGMDLELEGSGK